MCYHCKIKLKEDCMGKAQKQKGNRGERNAVKALLEIFPNVARDLNDPNDVFKIDLKNTEPFAIQVKHWKNHCPINIIDEIIPHDDLKMPVLLSMPTDRKRKSVVVMYLDDFIQIVDRSKIETK